VVPFGKPGNGEGEGEPAGAVAETPTTTADFSTRVRAPGVTSRPSLSRSIVFLNVWKKHARPFQAFLRGQEFP
jgi:hypothetical protein